MREQLSIHVVTVSTRASGGEYVDRSGPVIVEMLRALGHRVPDATVVADGDAFAFALTSVLTDGYDVVITSGGTGLAPDDTTPEVTRRVLDREVPGVAEAIRIEGRAAGVATAALSRGVCGVVDRTLVVNLPGSVGGARDGVAVITPLLVHAVDQIAGGDH